MVACEIVKTRDGLEHCIDSAIKPGCEFWMHILKNIYTNDWMKTDLQTFEEYYEKNLSSINPQKVPFTGKTCEIKFEQDVTPEEFFQGIDKLVDELCKNDDDSLKVVEIIPQNCTQRIYTVAIAQKGKQTYRFALPIQNKYAITKVNDKLILFDYNLDSREIILTQ